MMTRRAQTGFAIVSAVFLVVVLSLLGAMMVSMTSTQQVGATRDLLGSRAYFAAKAGIEWGAYQALQTGSLQLGLHIACAGRLGCRIHRGGHMQPQRPLR